MKNAAIILATIAALAVSAMAPAKAQGYVTTNKTLNFPLLLGVGY
jgi:hypothetical protein